MTNKTELLDLDRLEALARAATPGEWKAMPYGRVVGGPMRRYVNGSAQAQLAAFSVTFHEQAPDDEPERQQANTEFCAAANPAAVLALIALARRAQPEGEDECTVDHRELAGKILSFAGISSRGSLEPGADQLADRLAEKLAGWGVKLGQAEGEAPQAVAQVQLNGDSWMDVAANELPTWERKGFKTRTLYTAPAAQHAESGALKEELRATLIELCEARSKLIDANAELAMYHLAASAPGTPEAPASGVLCIGVAAPQGATVSVIQRKPDGTLTVLHGATHPVGDSMTLLNLASFTLLAKTAAAHDVLVERWRQVEAEGYDVRNDDFHVLGELGAYAAFYAMPPAARDWPATETGYGETFGEAIVPEGWSLPKPGDRRRELVKAGSLLLAEIERMDRAQGLEGGAA